jgi:hypothetical protein
MRAYLHILEQAGAVKTHIPVADIATDDLVAIANNFDHQAIQNYAK